MINLTHGECSLLMLLLEQQHAIKIINTSFLAKLNDNKVVVRWVKPVRFVCVTDKWGLGPCERGGSVLVSPGVLCWAESPGAFLVLCTCRCGAR